MDVVTKVRLIDAFQKRLVVRALLFPLPNPIDIFWMVPFEVELVSLVRLQQLFEHVESKVRTFQFRVHANHTETERQIVHLFRFVELVRIDSVVDDRHLVTRNPEETMHLF